MSCSGIFLRYFRLRHGISQTRLAAALGVPSNRLIEWEQERRPPDHDALTKLIDLTGDLDKDLLAGLSRSVIRSGLPRALSRTGKLTLQALSGPAIDKRPTIVTLIGENLAPIASDVLADMLGDAALQRAVDRRDVVGVVSTTRSVLKTAESETVGAFRTSVTYFFHEGVRYSDAVSVPVSLDERLGYTPIVPEEMGSDLFGDLDALAAGIASLPQRARCA